MATVKVNHVNHTNGASLITKSKENQSVSYQKQQQTTYGFLDDAKPFVNFIIGSSFQFITVVF
jgi:hypothetical protein